MPIATLSQDFVATARQPTLLASPVFHSRLLDNVDEVAALTGANAMLAETGETFADMKAKRLAP